MTQNERQWLAGWLEAEGSFVVDKNSPRIQVCCIDLDTMEKGAKIMGSSNIYPTKPCKFTKHQAYKMSVNGFHAIEIMLDILPLMGERRTQKITNIILGFDPLFQHMIERPAETRELFWLIGWLEGEGYFGISNGTPIVSGNATDLDIVESATALMSPDQKYKIKSKKGLKIGYKSVYQIRIFSRQAAILMRTILPWMSSRRSIRIKKALTHFDSIYERQVKRIKNCWDDPQIRERMVNGIKESRKDKVKNSQAGFKG